MPSRRRPLTEALGFLTFVVLVAAPVFAQDPPPSFPGGTELVVLDVVVHDEAGELVTDLKPKEIEVYEDGMACLLQSLRLVRAGEGEGPGPEVETETSPATSEDEEPPAVPYTPVATSSISSLEASAPRDDLEESLRPSVVVLVFGRLGMEAAGAAQEAAAAFVEGEFPSGTWFAVYEIGDRIRVRQSMTGDTTALATAIDEATGGAEGSGNRTAEGETLTREALSAALLATDDVTGVEALAPTVAATLRQPAGDAERKQREVAAQLGRAADTLSRQRLGGSALRALLAIALSLIHI